MKRIVVAIVDDEIAHYLSLKAFISKIPISVTVLHFADGKEMYDYLIKYASKSTLLPDYIFLDINMPRMDGWSFLEKYEKMQNILTKDISIYINSSSIEHKERAIKHPLVNDFLNKPISDIKVQEILIFEN